MLDYKLINNKAKIKQGETEYIDLLSQTFNKDMPVDGQLLIVNKYYIGRPDLISLACYGDDKYGDIICKINGISNPFELNENDIIYIPSINYILNCTNIKTNPSDLIKESTDEIQKINMTQKKISEKRSPNEQTIGESNFVIDKSTGLIFY